MKRGLTLFALLALVSVAVAAPAQAAGQDNFRAHLRGASEVPPVDTQGQGQSTFKLSADGTELDYRLIVANIDEVTQAHIHCGGPDVNGPVVAFLFGFVDGGVTQNGVLAQGTITAADVIPRPDSEVCPGGLADFDEMIAKMRSGGAYVNAHTVDSPGGEIRGHLRTGGPS